MKELTLTHIILIYLVAVNLLTFFLFGIDKWKAQRNKWRIQESTLMWLSVFGGSIGALLGMRVWHHKTLHKKFKFGVPLILLVQVALIAIIIYLYKKP